MRWPRGTGHTEFPRTFDPRWASPWGSPSGVGVQPPPAEPGPNPNAKMETYPPAKFMLWPEAASLPSLGLGLHPRTECFPWGMAASRRGQAGSRAGDGWEDRAGPSAESPRSHGSLLGDPDLLHNLSEPQVSQPPSLSPSRPCGRAAASLGDVGRRRKSTGVGWEPRPQLRFLSPQWIKGPAHARASLNLFPHV